MRHSKLFAIATSLVLLGVGCDDQGDNYLKGSIATSYRMGFDSVRIRQYESELSIEYVEDTAEGEKISLKVTLDLRDGLPAAGIAYDLYERGDISRGAGYGSDLPDLESGELRLEKYGSSNGSEVKGDFEAIFIADDGSRLSLRGGFLANLEVVE